uniref:Uncharacterized protein n=1 Tax=Cyanistes caeruleus TaxID=156563 RepID=A0A8C0ZC58_CYACU
QPQPEQRVEGQRGARAAAGRRSRPEGRRREAGAQAALILNILLCKCNTPFPDFFWKHFNCWPLADVGARQN